MLSCQDFSMSTVLPLRASFNDILGSCLLHGCFHTFRLSYSIGFGPFISSSFFQVFFLLGRLPSKLSSFQVIILLGNLLVRSSFFEVVFFFMLYFLLIVFLLTVSSSFFSVIFFLGHHYLRSSFFKSSLVRQLLFVSLVTQF